LSYIQKLNQSIIKEGSTFYDNSLSLIIGLSSSVGIYWSVGLIDVDISLLLCFAEQTNAATDCRNGTSGSSSI